MNVLLAEPNRENIFDAPAGNKTAAAVAKRGIANCPSSLSKRPALSNVTNRSGATGTRDKPTQLAQPILTMPTMSYGSFLPSAPNGLFLSLSHSSSAESTHNVSFNSSTSSFGLSSSVRSMSPDCDSPMIISSPDVFVDVSPIDDDDTVSSEYTADIFAHLRQLESELKPAQGYMSQQKDVTGSMRGILVDWLVEVCDEFKLNPETFYLAVSYTDRYLSRESVVRSKLQLVGTTCMFLAAKYEEIYPPSVGEFAYITDDTYSPKQIARMEKQILEALDFRLVSPTIHTFLSRYLKASKVDSAHLAVLEQVENMAKYLCERALQDVDPFHKYLPSIVASSAICLSRHTFGLTPWPVSLQYYSQYSISDISQCIQDLHRSQSMAHCHPQQAIRQKYSAEKYSRVALINSSETLPC